MLEDDEFVHTLKSLDNQTWDMGVSRTGTQRLIHIQDGEIITEKRFDAEPLADDCEQSRIATAGEGWGEMRRVGSIRIDDLMALLELYDGNIPWSAYQAYFHANPQNIRFDKALK